MITVDLDHAALNDNNFIAILSMQSVRTHFFSSIQCLEWIVSFWWVSLCIHHFVSSFLSHQFWRTKFENDFNSTEIGTNLKNLIIRTFSREIRIIGQFHRFRWLIWRKKQQCDLKWVSTLNGRHGWMHRCIAVWKWLVWDFWYFVEFFSARWAYCSSLMHWYVDDFY